MKHLLKTKPSQCVSLSKLNKLNKLSVTDSTQKHEEVFENGNLARLADVSEPRIMSVIFRATWTMSDSRAGFS